MSLAATALNLAYGRNSSSKSARSSLETELDRALTEIALLKEELGIKEARWRRLPSRRRPYYAPVQRMRILQLKAARGWSCEQSARAFLINEQTLRSWMSRADEEGDRSLIQTAEPVNRFPDFVRYLVQQLGVLLPSMGKLRIAQVLARAGLHLGATTVGRMLKEDQPPENQAEALLEVDVVPTQVVTAKRPGQVWHVDLTTVPTWGGFCVPWLPHAWPQSWPFCWWVAVVIDHFSRAALGFAVFPKQPTSAEVQRFLNRAIRNGGVAPKYVISDKGTQFWCDSFKDWCTRRRIRPRFGAVKKYGSIAVIERFIRSMKSECTRRILVPIALDAMRRELTLYVTWFNEHRPSQALGGRTPREVHEGMRPANAIPRLEPRPLWPQRSGCASPPAEINGAPGSRFTLAICFLEGRKHLPIVELRRAA
ncbi:MAG: transposase [bacterium]|nr:transposase [bacterium]